MSSFQAAGSYSAGATLLIGLLTFAGCTGAGLGALYCSGWRRPFRWMLPASALFGILMLSASVQLLGFTRLATVRNLEVVWLAFVIIGGGVAFLAAAQSRMSADCMSIAAAAIPQCVLGLCATAPSTKLDEIYYHMLVPARIVFDGRLRFYRFPWEGAIYPQLLYQIACAPFHAMQRPDAGNVVSWCLSMTLVFVICSRITARPLRAAAALLLSSGLYPVVWHVTSGAHVFGELALCCAVLALIDRGATGGSDRTDAFVVTLFYVAAAGAKISNVPVTTVIWVLSLIAIYRRSGRAVRLAPAIVPLIFIVPLTLWTWRVSGSPAGPMLTNIFGSHMYGNELAGLLAKGRLENRVILPLRVLLDWPAAFWVAAAVPLFATGRTRWLLGGLVALQLVLIVGLLPYDFRFLGGLQYAACAIGLQQISAQRSSGRARTAAIVAASVIPWLAVQLFYAAPLMRVSIGVTQPADFLGRYVALYDDFKLLDRRLPARAELLLTGRAASVYSSRRVIYDAADHEEGLAVFSLAIPRSCLAGGDTVLLDPAAIVKTWRTPGRAPERACIIVRPVALPSPPLLR